MPALSDILDITTRTPLKASKRYTTNSTTKMCIRLNDDNQVRTLWDEVTKDMESQTGKKKEKRQSSFGNEPMTSDTFPLPSHACATT